MLICLFDLIDVRFNLVSLIWFHFIDLIWLMCDLIWFHFIDFIWFHLISFYWFNLIDWLIWTIKINSTKKKIYLWEWQNVHWLQNQLKVTNVIDWRNFDAIGVWQILIFRRVIDEAILLKFSLLFYFIFFSDVFFFFFFVEFVFCSDHFKYRFQSRKNLVENVEASFPFASFDNAHLFKQIFFFFFDERRIYPKSEI